MHYQTWLIFAFTNLLMQISILSHREIKIYWKNSIRCRWWSIFCFETNQAVVDKSFIRKSTNICKSIVGIDASQLYPYSMCQLLPTGLFSRWDIDSETSRFTPRQNKIRSFENMVMSYFQRTRPDSKNESFYTTGRQKKIDRFSVDGF